MLRVALFGACLLFSALPCLGADAFKHENKPENLQAIYTTLHGLIHGRDYETGAALLPTLMPTEEGIGKALKPDVSDEIFQKVWGMHKSLVAPNETSIRTMSKPEQTEIDVQAASTEELSKYEKGSQPYKHFP